jgi:peptidyl-tRNA hydrolase, PTH1 family
VKVIVGIGNPGGEYEDTRHNVGWWVVDRLRQAWGFGPFKRERNARVSTGKVGEHTVQLIKPTTYVNRSGSALGPLRTLEDFDVARDLLVVVDDVALDVGRFRVRASGSAGGHNGLKSIQTVLGTQDYARMRIGVGAPPSGADLADWVLSAFPADAEQLVVDLLADVTDATKAWVEQGAEAAMRFNR